MKGLLQHPLKDCSHLLEILLLMGTTQKLNKSIRNSVKIDLKVGIT